jgi:hypothetical protein
MEEDHFVEMRSQVGNVLLAPSIWSTEEQGSSWYIRSTDGHAVISVFTYKADGSGSLEDFGNLIATWTLPDGETGWQASSWSPIVLKQNTALMRVLTPTSEQSEFRWRVYVIHTGRMYHAIVLNASEPMMFLNGDFYESIIQSFEGIE